MPTIDKSGSREEEKIRAFRNEYQIRDWELNYEILKKAIQRDFRPFCQQDRPGTLSASLPRRPGKTF
jgi:hypothetical protein